MNHVASFCVRVMVNMQKTLLVAWAAAWLAQPLFAVNPVVVWNGATKDFSSLQRTIGDNTYTLNLGLENTVSDNNSHILIGNDNAHAGVTITVANSNPAVTNGFGTGGALTVIMKCRNMPVDAEGNRAIITLMDGKKYKWGSTTDPENGAVVGMYINNGNSGWVWKGSAANASLSGDFCNTVSGAFSADEQMVALTYSNASGTAYYVNGELVQSSSGLKARELAAPCGISLGGVDSESGWQFFALSGMQIDAIAVFTSTLSASEVAAFEFAANTINVSAINAEHGYDSDIDVEVDDGTIILGDTTFNASTVHFICDGSLTFAPPAGNAATLDFSGVTGRTVIRYNEGVLPTASGTTFTATTVPTSVTDPSTWTGTIWLRDIANVTEFNVNSYGNASSCVRLTGISGWLRAPGNYTFTNTVPVELSNEGSNAGYALKITNGNSANSDNPLRCTAFVKITGSGTLADETSTTPLIKVFDLSEFSGDIRFASASLVVCDPTTPYTSFYDMYGSHKGSLRIEEGKSVDVAWGKTWYFRNVACFGTPSGHGTIAIGGDLAPEGAFTNAAWMGTLSVTNLAAAKPFNIHLLGNSGSTVALSAIGANGAYLPASDVEAGKVVLTDDGNGAALALNDGYSNANTTFSELAGTGTFSQSKATIFQGLTINALTDFTGTLALNKMTVTFGTAKRIGQKYENGGWVKDDDTASKLFVDPDAVLSVPAGFSLWAPAAVVLNGPIDFKTDATDFRDLLLLDNVGTTVSFGPNFAVSINGTSLNLGQGSSYKVVKVADTLVLKRFGSAIRFR